MVLKQWRERRRLSRQERQVQKKRYEELGGYEWLCRELLEQINSSGVTYFELMARLKDFGVAISSGTVLGILSRYEYEGLVECRVLNRNREPLGVPYVITQKGKGVLIAMQARHKKPQR